MNGILKRNLIALLTLVTLLCGSLLLPVPRTVRAAETTYSVTYKVTYGQTEARKMTALVNGIRGENESLTYDYTLEQIAMKRAAEIALYYSKTRPKNSDFTTAYPDAYADRKMAENIASGALLTTAETAFETWNVAGSILSGDTSQKTMKSTDYQYIGVGHVTVNGVHFWTQEFSSGLGSTTETVANDSADSSFTTDLDATFVTSRTLYAGLPTYAVAVGNSTDLPNATGTITTKGDNNRIDTVTMDLSGVTYTSSKPDVAYVTNGKLYGKSAGTATITATGTIVGQTASSEIEVTVTSGGATDPATPTGVTLNKTSLSLIAGDEETLTATVVPDTAADKAVTWKSSDIKVATVSVNGKVTAVAEGRATITATTVNEKTATCVVNVAKKITITTLFFNEENVTVVKGNTHALSLTVVPQEAVSTLVWTSSEPQIATVSQTGVVTAVAAGSVTISVHGQDETLMQTCTVTVKEAGNPTDDTAAQIKAVTSVKTASPSIKAGKKKVALTLKRAKYSGAGYQIQIKKSGGSWKSYSTTGLKKTIKNLKSGKKYTIRVRSYKKIDEKKYYSKWSKLKSVKVK